MLTEAEAATKWCPFVRLVRVDNAIYSSRGPIMEVPPSTKWPEPVNCIGSACMAWRWLREPHSRFIGADLPDSERFDEATQEPPRPAKVPASWTFQAADCDAPCGWREPEAEAMTRRTGRCGLAGAPQ